MQKIKVLPETVQNQIAAGEVVERPASIVKELVENSLDAESKRIKIEVEEGGIKTIKVTDDGTGIEKGDIKLSLSRYATSKLSSITDLTYISSFGFRGEALASISSVSNLVLESKTDKSDLGCRIKCDFGKISDIEEIGMPIGTNIIIRNLFKNIPARYKYLKGQNIEYNHILSIIQHCALVNPKIGFTLINNKKKVLELYPIISEDIFKSFEERLSALLGSNTVSKMLKIDFKRPEFILRGYIGLPSISRSNRLQQFLFVNRRSVKSAVISGAVNEAFRSLLPHGKYPVYFFDIEITSDLIDINVHPRKLEVRFLKQSDVYNMVKQAIETVISKQDRVFGSNIWKEQEYGLENYKSNSSSKNINGSDMYKTKDSYSYKKEDYLANKTNNIKNAFSFSKTLLENKIDNKIKINPFENLDKTYRVIGQLKNSYILIEAEEGLVIMDQHAAHERVRYEKLLDNFNKKEKNIQKLLLPEEITLSLVEKDLLENNIDFLIKLGFDIKFEEKKCTVFGVPAILKDTDIDTLIRGLYDNIVSFEKGKTIEDKQKEMLTYLSCKKSVKFGDILSIYEMEKLYKDWLVCKKRDTCPHGREITYTITYDEIKKKVCR